MNPEIKIQNIKDSKVKIDVEFSASDFDSFLDTAIEELGKDVEVQGFRKGKAPKDIVEKSLGEHHIMEHATSDAMNFAYIKAVKENKLEVIGDPDIKIEKCAKGNPFTFTIEVAVLPKFEIPDYKKIAKDIKKNKVEFSEKEMEDALKWLQGSMAQTNPKDGIAEEGDWVEITYSINENKEVKDAFILGKGKLIADIEKNINGMKSGETKECEFKFPEKTESAKCKITLTSLKSITLPEINDELAKLVGGFETLDALKENIKNDILKNKEIQEEQRIVQEVLSKIGEKIKDVAIPDVLIDSEVNQTIADFKARLSRESEVNFDEYLKQTKQTEEEMKKALRPKTEIKIREYLVLKEIQKQEEIEVTEDEVSQETSQIMQKYPDLRDVDLQNLVEYTKERLENQKTYQKIASYVEG
jgi:trigger factor